MGLELSKLPVKTDITTFSLIENTPLQSKQDGLDNQEEGTKRKAEDCLTENRIRQMETADHTVELIGENIIQLQHQQNDALIKPQHQQNDTLIKPQHQQNDTLIKPQHQQNDALIKPQHKQNDALIKPQHQQNDALIKPQHQQNNTQIKPQHQQNDALIQPVQLDDAEQFHHGLMTKYKTSIAGYLRTLAADPSDTEIQCDLNEAIIDLFFEMDIYPYWVDLHHRKVCEYIQSNVKIVEAVFDSISDQDGQFYTEISSLCLHALTVIHNLSDLSLELSKFICNKPRFLSFLYHTCNKYKDMATDAEVELILIRVLGIIHNLAMKDITVVALRELKFVSVLQPYLGFTNQTIRLTAILAMADIMSENESYLLLANDVKFLVNIFNKSVKEKGHKASDDNEIVWSSLELVKGIGRVARNDGNKRLLIELGCLPSILILAISENQQESEESFKTLSTIHSQS